MGSITFDTADDAQSQGAIEGVLAYGRTPQDIANMVMSALDHIRSVAETAKSLPLFTHLSSGSFKTHLAIVVDRGGVQNAETAMKALIDAALGTDQDVYMDAAFQCVKTMRLNLPHIEQYFYTKFKAAHDAATLDSTLEPALATCIAYLQSVGLLPT